MRNTWLGILAVVALAGCGPTKIPARDLEPPPPRVSPVVQAMPVAVASSDPAAIPQPTLEPCTGHEDEEPPVTFLKGQVHIHTERSFDAETPVPDVITFYAERGYDFLSITDHNHITIAKEHPSNVLLIPGVELTYNASACEPPPRPGYLCAFHANVLFLNPMRDTTRGRHFILPFRKHRLEVFDVLIQRNEELEGLLVLNHPTYHYAVNATLLYQLVRRGIRHVEFFNGGVMDRSKDGPLAEVERGEQLWDAMLDLGLQVFAVGGDDAHHFADAATIRMMGKKPLVGDRAWVMVRAAKEEASLRSAIRDGDYYVSTGVSLSRLEVNEKQVHVTVVPKKDVAYVTRFVGDGGHILARVDGLDACYPIAGSEGYVRAVVEADDGTFAWTQAVMLKKQPDTNVLPEEEGPLDPPEPPHDEPPTVW